MKATLKLAAVALSAMGIVGGAALAEGTSYSSDSSITPKAASPMSGFSTNGTPRGNAVYGVRSNHDASGADSASVDTGTPPLQPRTDRN